MIKDPLTKHTGTSTAIAAATEAVNYQPPARNKPMRAAVDTMGIESPYRDPSQPAMIVSHHERYVEPAMGGLSKRPAHPIDRKALAETNKPASLNGPAVHAQSKRGYGHGSR